VPDEAGFTPERTVAAIAGRRAGLRPNIGSISNEIEQVVAGAGGRQTRPTRPWVFNPGGHGTDGGIRGLRVVRKQAGRVSSKQAKIVSGRVCHGPGSRPAAARARRTGSVAFPDGHQPPPVQQRRGGTRSGRLPGPPGCWRTDCKQGTAACSRPGEPGGQRVVIEQSAVQPPRKPGVLQVPWPRPSLSSVLAANHAR